MIRENRYQLVVLQTKKLSKKKTHDPTPATKPQTPQLHPHNKY
ncbi:hypothetical protein CAEBREN_14378 [Caenorhabditis brenneri]|uniref:Uncharacterized protein n=1 Tax=Caenorhabditis brenneri TaxID=135651 RepID=G0MWW1_CAEBE|nr:hypothetical protein CAEBREN_14378 [Caenorhabditis brenneri]